MRKSRFTEAQIIGMIKEQEAGLPTAELCRKHGLSPATFYKVKTKYGGMDLSDTKRLKQLEDENARLKRLVITDSCANCISAMVVRQRDCDHHSMLSFARSKDKVIRCEHGFVDDQDFPIGRFVTVQIARENTRRL